MVASSLLEYVSVSLSINNSTRYLYVKPHRGVSLGGGGLSSSSPSSSSSSVLFLCGFVNAEECQALFSTLQQQKKTSSKKKSNTPSSKQRTSGQLALSCNASHLEIHRSGKACLIAFANESDASMVLNAKTLPSCETPTRGLASWVQAHEAENYTLENQTDLATELDVFMAEFDNAELASKRRRDAAIRSSAAADANDDDGGGWTVVTRRRKGAGKRSLDDDVSDEEAEGDGWQLASKSFQALPLAMAERLAAEIRGQTALANGDTPTSADAAAASLAASRAKKKRKKDAAALGLPSFYRHQNERRLRESFKRGKANASDASARLDAARRAAERLARQ